MFGQSNSGACKQKMDIVIRGPSCLFLIIILRRIFGYYTKPLTGLRKAIYISTPPTKFVCLIKEAIYRYIIFYSKWGIGNCSSGSSGVGQFNFDWESEIRDMCMIEHMWENVRGLRRAWNLTFFRRHPSRDRERERNKECVITTITLPKVKAAVVHILNTQTHRARERERFGLDFRAFKFLLILFSFLSFLRTDLLSMATIYIYIYARISISIISGSLYITYPFDYWTPKLTDRPTNHEIIIIICVYLFEREREREKSLFFDGFECALFLLGKQPWFLQKQIQTPPKIPFFQDDQSQYIYIYKIHSCN